MKLTFPGAILGVAFVANLLTAQGPLSKDGLPKHALVRIGDSRFHGGGHRLHFSPDGKTLAIADDEKIRLLDPATGLERLVVRHLSKSNVKSTAPTPQDVVEFAYFADGKTIASADFTGILRLWNVDAGKETKLPDPHPGIATLCLSADERSLFTAGFDGVLNEWQLPSGKLKQSWKAPEAILAITRLGTKIAGVTRDGTLFHWDPATGQDSKRIELGPVLVGGGVMQDFGAHKFPMKGSVSPTFTVRPRNVEFSPDGKRLAQIQGRQIWDVETGKVLTNLTVAKSSVRFAFSHDNKNVVMAPTGFKDSMQLADSATGDVKAKLDVGRVESVAFSPDGQTVAFSAENRIRLWVHAKNKIAGGEGAIGAIRDWDISPDGRDIAVSTKDKLIKIYDLTSGKLKDSFETEPRMADIVRFSADGKTLIAGISNIAVMHFEKKNGVWKIEKRFAINEQLHQFRGAGPYALIGNQYQRPFDLNSGKARQGLQGASRYSQATYSPDGKQLLVAAEVPLKKGSPALGGTLREYQLFQVPELKRVRSIKAPARGSSSVRFSPDGRTLLLDASPVQVIELLTGAERMSIPLSIMHRALEFAPDGNSLLAGTAEGGLAVIGMPKGQELLRIEKAHTGPVRVLSMTSGGEVVSISSDDSLLVWSPELWKGRASVKPLKLDPEDLELLYKNIEKRDGGGIGSSMASLIAGGDATAQFLQARLKPAAAETPISLLAEPDSTRIREHRCIEILERIGTATAVKTLEIMARGHERAASTIEARESIARLTK